jgi:hypothetical protein
MRAHLMTTKNEKMIMNNNPRGLIKGSRDARCKRSGTDGNNNQNITKQNINNIPHLWEAYVQDQ